MEARSVAPLIVVVGPTASGKTSAAIELAKKWDGEIICADSRTIYTGMDIGTAKPRQDERFGVPHWGLDIVNPDEKFTASDFKKYVEDRVRDIRRREKVPFLVGGTGLYIDSVIFNFDFNGRKEVREDWRKKPMGNVLMVGIATDRAVLRSRIEQRAEHMFSNGVVEEATMLGKKYGWELPSMTGNIYPVIKSYLDGEINLDQAVDRFATLDWQLAKRQMTWFRPNPFIKWCSLTDVSAYVDRWMTAE